MDLENYRKRKNKLLNREINVIKKEHNKNCYFY